MRGWAQGSRSEGGEGPGFHTHLMPPCCLTVNNWLATVTLGQAGMHATYYHKASEQVRWAGEQLQGHALQAWAAGGRCGRGLRPGS